MRIALVFFTGAVTLSAQIIDFGVKTGVVLKDATPPQSIYSAASGTNLTGGPTVEFHLPYRLSVEVDVLFRTYSQTSLFAVPTIAPGVSGGIVSPGGLFSTQTHTKVQEFPFLLKYRFLDGPIRPFVTAGGNVALQTQHSDSVFTCLAGAGSCTSNVRFLDSTSYHVGPAGGLGIDFKVGRIHIDPEVRYSRRSNPKTNEVSALVGFTFGK